MVLSGRPADRYTRRLLLKQLAAATTVPLLLRPACLAGSTTFAYGEGVEELAWSATRYRPQYPAQSPLEDVLRLVTPGLDEYPTEKHAFEIAEVLLLWKRGLESHAFDAMQGTFAAGAQLGQLVPSTLTTLRDRHGIASVRCNWREGAAMLDGAAFPSHVGQWLGPSTRVEHADFEMTAIEEAGTSPIEVRSTIRFSLVLQTGAAVREQRIGIWSVGWQKQALATGAWLVTTLQPLQERRCSLRGRGFEDVTQYALGNTASYQSQMLTGLDAWRSRIDGASGIDVYGNNGVAVGDYDGDGLDDLYVSQPAGLPNRLYRNRGDGTFEDVTEKAGVGVLDNTACALFADFRNVGLQDLLVVCGSGPLLFQNRGDGTFARKRDAFHFATPPQGSFTHAAVADYDRDGRLDIYFCLYSYYLGLDQYHYPTPYFDARNGPPNFLMHNQGDGTFEDRTHAAGLSAENDRYSFACAWGDTVAGKSPDLYVVNDFGRNNLYRSQGDGTFRAVSEQAHVQDVGAGMSACWTDVNGDGKPDLYVANMWSAAGQRVAQQPNFHARSSAATRALYQRHARGNALYRNNGDGTFTNAGDPTGVEPGRWAWGSDAWDFDHDGSQDLYVTNGYITAAAAEQQPGDAGADLGSFFWRQVVAKSPDDATPSLPYERGWNALHELIRADHSWSGHERNVLFVNHGDGTFGDVSGAAGLDFLEDGRAFALADLDGDGRFEAVVKNRNAPQVRIVHNSMEHLGDSLVLRLRGTRSNRDAIGTVVEVEAGAVRQTLALQAGTGFLAQHSKELLFGLGSGSEPVHATVHWPSGEVQRFAALPRNQRITIVEGTATFAAKPFAATPPGYRTPQAHAGTTARVPLQVGTWLLEPLRAPAFALPSAAGETVTLESLRGAPVLLWFYDSQNAGSAAKLHAVDRENARASATGLRVVAVDLAGRREEGTPRASQGKIPVLLATPAMAGVYNLIFRYLFDRRADLPVPTSFLLDAGGMIVKVYPDAVALEVVARDVAAMPATPEQRQRLALPFAGELLQDSFRRNDFTYGVAMFQHGYFEEAAESFEQVIARRPEDAEAQYNLGTLHLRRGELQKARQNLERTLQLKPDYPEAWNNLGMLAAQQGDSAEATKSFERSLQLRPTYTTALLNLGNLYRHEHQFALAQQYLSRALALQPDDPEANYGMAMLDAQQGQMAEAERLLQRAIALRPAYPEALTNLGVLLVRQGDYPSAEEAFRTSVRLAPDFEGAYLSLASLYVLQREPGKARDTLEVLVRLHPQSTAASQALRSLNEAH